jgi:arylsulfatase A-like enzyme
VIDQLSTAYDAEMFWLVPLSNMLLLAAMALAVWLGLAWTTMAFRIRLIGLLLGTITAFGIGLLFPRIHVAAAALLALGAGIRLSVLLSDRRKARYIFTRTSQWMGAALAIGIISTGPLARAVSTARLARLPQAEPNAPNVLLLILDTVRARSLSIYADSLATSPRLASFAQRGILFERAIAPTSWTLPSHASMFTGRPPHQLSADWEVPLDNTFPVVAEAFAAAGYATGAFVANRIAAGPNSGLTRGFATYRVDAFSLGRIVTGASFPRWCLFSPRLRDTGYYAAILIRKDGRHVNRQFLRWLDRIEKRPFFAFLNFMDAHEPYWPPAAFAAMTDGRRVSGMVPASASEDSAKAAEALSAYHGSIRYLDTVIGELLDKLELRGMLANTVVMITSDHGEAFGERGVTKHGNALYMSQIHVPLLIVRSGVVPAGRREPRVASLTDVASTLLDLGDVDPLGIQGRSLARYWQTDAPPRDAGAAYASLRYRPRPEDTWPIARGPMAAVVEDSLYLVRNGDGTNEMFRLDSIQGADIAPTAPDEAIRLRALLDHAIPRDSTLTPAPEAGQNGDRTSRPQAASEFLSDPQPARSKTGARTGKRVEASRCQTLQHTMCR